MDKHRLRVRHFLSHFLLLMALVTLLPTIFGILLGYFYNQQDNEEVVRLSSGVIAHARQAINYTTPEANSRELKKLEELYGFPFHLLRAPPPELDQAEQEQLASGEVVFSRASQRLYVPSLEQGVLEIGPISVKGFNMLDWLNDRIELALVWLLFTATVFAALTYLYLRPLWYDLMRLRKTAESLSSGDMGARCGELSSSILGLLRSSFNSMASKLERLIKDRQKMANAMAHEMRTPIARIRFGLAMQDEAATDEKRAQYRTGIERDLRNIEDLISTLMEHGRLNWGESA
ncbi:histidine kinase dimerization/phospho-acceptor domain-containing protein [Dongshaea marina]|uniref:histidine kinase dimerization/phospho-acceptor domain-containing protein n=1 Tax=Dongshaea marina TaxID=2047966 RepID=UPI00131F3042|nr:histidine kinase dimerization/phospho-acceptor domain-containing protein [Dongshaea marina]